MEWLSSGVVLAELGLAEFRRSSPKEEVEELRVAQNTPRLGESEEGNEDAEDDEDPDKRLNHIQATDLAYRGNKSVPVKESVKCLFYKVKGCYKQGK